VLVDLKEMAAREAVKHVKDGMVVGLGSGSTASIAIRFLGDKVKEGWKLVGVPTSRDSEVLGKSVGITIDGADEVDPELNLIKGLGGALVREKIVAAATKVEIIIVDESKLVGYLGQKAPLPVEIVKFASESTMRRLQKFGCVPTLREKNGLAFITDNGNLIADCRFQRIDNPAKMESDLNLVPGVVDNGLFVGLTDKVIVASKAGVRTIEGKS
jgi:ribose 5-phosphate isomerase A